MNITACSAATALSSPVSSFRSTKFCSAPKPTKFGESHSLTQTGLVELLSRQHELHRGSLRGRLEFISSVPSWGDGFLHALYPVPSDAPRILLERIFDIVLCSKNKSKSEKMIQDILSLRRHSPLKECEQDLIHLAHELESTSLGNPKCYLIMAKIYILKRATEALSRKFIQIRRQADF